MGEGEGRRASHFQVEDAFKYHALIRINREGSIVRHRDENRPKGGLSGNRNFPTHPPRPIVDDLPRGGKTFFC